jgi:hypothetical protein
MHLDDELMIFNTIFFLKKHFDPSCFQFLGQFVDYGVEKINQLLKFFQICWDVKKKRI